MVGEHTIDEPKVAEPEIVLTIPAEPEFLRLARLAAADVGSRCGLAYEEVDDLRIAVDELCHAIMGGAELPDPTKARTLEIHFTLLADGVAIEATCTNDATPRLNDLSAAILAAVVDEHEISGGVGGVSRFRMVKRVRFP
jgi:anti-sigma regulatory factor (Ser/Thr protein kinase)